MDQLQVQYSKLEFVTKGASKLLGNCKPCNITKELKKLKQKDTALLEAANTALRSQVAELKVELGMKDEEIRQLKEQKMEALEQIWEIVVLQENGYINDFKVIYLHLTPTAK